MAVTSMWQVRASLLLLTVSTTKGALAFQSTISRGLSLQRPTRAKLFSAKSDTRRIWREEADPKQHLDFMITRSAGGMPVETSRDNLLNHYVYFLRLDSKFCFVFQGLGQVYQCRAYFSRKIHPHTRNRRSSQERYHHDMGPWYCRLPKGITETKRQMILKQLNLLIERYGEDTDFVRERRNAVNEKFHSRTDWLKEQRLKRAFYRENLLQQLRQEPAVSTNVDSLVWTAIEEEV